MNRRVKGRTLLLGALALALASTSVAAMTIERLDVRTKGKGYYVRFVAHLQAPPAAVMKILMDYDRYPELDPRIAEAHIVEARPVDGDEPVPVLYTRLRGCLGWGFCRDMERYEKLTHAEGVLIAEAIPGRGDLTRGRAETHIVADGTGSRVTYRNEFQPSFSIPRWLVRAWMRQTLKQGTRHLFENVEQRARETQPP